MSRISIFSFLITILIFLFYSRRSKIVLRKNVFNFGIFIILILIGTFILNYQAYIEQMAYFYQPLYAVFGMSDLVNDTSSSVRLIQFDAIKDTILNNFFLVMAFKQSMGWWFFSIKYIFHTSRPWSNWNYMGVWILWSIYSFNAICFCI